MTYTLNYYSVIVGFSQQHTIDITYTLKYLSNFNYLFKHLLKLDYLPSILILIIINLSSFKVFEIPYHLEHFQII